MLYHLIKLVWRIKLEELVSVDQRFQRKGKAEIESIMSPFA